MATWIPNQPVFFGNLSNNCSCDPSLGAQLADNSDVTQFQFDIEPCSNAENFIEDQDFNDITQWTFGVNWSMAYNQLCVMDGVLADQITYGQNVFQDGKYYKLTVVVDSVSNGSLEVYIGDTLFGEITVSGTYDFYGFATTNSTLGGCQLVFKTSHENVNACMSNIQVYEIATDFKFAIYNSENQFQGIISYQDNPSYFTLSKNSLTVNIDWGEIGITDGCYYICLLDPCINTNGQNTPITITNPGFTGSATGWTLNGDWVYGTNSVDWFTGPSVPDNGKLTQEIFPSYSLFSNVTVVVTSISGTLNVYFGTLLIGTITTPGTHQFSGTPFGGLDFSLEPLENSSGSVDSVTWTAPTSNDYTCDLQSNTFKLSDYTGACTVLVNGCNNSDGLGFVFDSSNFSPRLRIEAKLKQAKYPNERSIYEDSAGEKTNTYFRRRKAKYLCVDLQPEYIHDFLSLALGFNNFYIDNLAYFVEDDEYTVDYNEANDSLGKVKILVSQKIQNVTSTNCTSEQNVCSLDGDFLLQDNLGFYLTQVDGFKIKING